MAHHKSAKKRIRRNGRRYEINHARKSRIRTFVKNVEAGIAKGDKDGAREALKMAEPELQRGARKGVIHRNTAARKISRLFHRINAMS
ncbi:30S ribosomal protein S20 [Ferruginivarius sediminum]|uniref:Small ribosomal subunit protein bS20 n=1 Tax=Ferruginivarius sediminum TaxID=2661937 RepID=A0A369TJK8_9PROT|nr:30S ribosomal protein S20 [Ferruginivarius sediminum]RDD63086.1 30S ribosomal protein S20 [Ferruginivarius sediminum]